MECNGGMTDRQFKAYNRLLNLLDEIIEQLPEDEQKKYKETKKQILLNQ